MRYFAGIRKFNGQILQKFIKFRWAYLWAFQSRRTHFGSYYFQPFWILGFLPNMAGLNTWSLIGFGFLSAKELRYFARIRKFNGQILQKVIKFEWAHGLLNPGAPILDHDIFCHFGFLIFFQWQIWNCWNVLIEIFLNHFWIFSFIQRHGGNGFIESLQIFVKILG